MVMYDASEDVSGFFLALTDSTQHRIETLKSHGGAYLLVR